jgi:Flp pilus assembly protein TadD
MKKLQTILAALTLLVATSAFAANGPEKVNAAVKKSFTQQFSTASNVNWEKTDDFYFAYFTMNNKEVSAAYNEQGELIGTSKIIAAAELPMAIGVAISQKYNGYTVGKTATEIHFDGQTAYYITVQNEKQTLKLKCLANGDISTESKIKK